MDGRGSADLEMFESMVDKILSIPDQHPYLISTTIQLVEQSPLDADPDEDIHPVWSQYEDVHQALCSWINSNSDSLSEPISPVSLDLLEVHDGDEQTATVHSISQIHPQAHPTFERLMKLEFEPVIDQLNGSSVISINARPIVDDE